MAHLTASRPADTSPCDHFSPTHFGGRSIHFIGIGGCGMNGLARMLKSLGASCSGSDTTASDVTSALIGDGIPVGYKQNADSIPESSDLIIVSAAISSQSEIIQEVESRGIEIRTYAEMVGQVQREYLGISIAGTHGKSTTAAMLCHILLECGLDPSFIIGANCPQIGGSSRSSVKRKGIFVAEACEFNRSFHNHHPVIALINNLEADHLDIYGTLDAVVLAFAEFAQRIPSAEDGGHLLIAHDGAHKQEVTAGLTCRCSTFGISSDADYQVVINPDLQNICIRHDGAQVASWKNVMPGEHNALNAAAAVILASLLGAEWDRIGRAMDGFLGLERRMQRLGEQAVGDGSVVVYDDYGHHPTEIVKTLAALRAREKPRRLICVFQPHQHSRTRLLLDQFAQSFADADLVIVPHIYFVRDEEEEKQHIGAADLVAQLRENGVDALHIDSFSEVVNELKVLCRAGDMLVIMGAGPVGQVGHKYLQCEGL